MWIAVGIAVVFFVLILGDRFAVRPPAILGPPMSDEEFIGSLPVGTDPEVALKVRGIISEQLGIDRELIRPETNLADICDC